MAQHPFIRRVSVQRLRPGVQVPLRVLGFEPQPATPRRKRGECSDSYMARIYAVLCQHRAEVERRGYRTNEGKKTERRLLRAYRREVENGN